jgi:predicted RNA polymerase sigma factor
LLLCWRFFALTAPVLIEQGKKMLEQSAAGEQVSRYHLEAMIAYEHAAASSFERTNWSNIIAYYNILYQMNPSPIVALNQAIAIAERDGPQAGITAIEKIPNPEKLQQYYLLPAALGELHARLHHTGKAAAYLTEAIRLTQSDAEKRLLQHKLNGLDLTP